MYLLCNQPRFSRRSSASQRRWVSAAVEECLPSPLLSLNMISQNLNSQLLCLAAMVHLLFSRLCLLARYQSQFLYQSESSLWSASWLEHPTTIPQYCTGMFWNVNILFIPELLCYCIRSLSKCNFKQNISCDDPPRSLSRATRGHPPCPCWAPPAPWACLWSWPFGPRPRLFLWSSWDSPPVSPSLYRMQQLVLEVNWSTNPHSTQQPRPDKYVQTLK